MNQMGGIEGAFVPERPDGALLEVLGERLARRRLRLNLGQRDLAEQAGISRPTVQRLEAGESTQLTSLIRVLRVLGLLENLDLLVPSPEVAPMERLERGGRPRQRASSARERAADGGDAAASSGWTWGEDREPEDGQA